MDTELKIPEVKKSKWYIWVIVILLILVIVLGVMNFFDLSNKDKEKEKEPDPTPGVTIVTERPVDFTSCFEDNTDCIKYISINNKNVKLEFKSVGESEEPFNKHFYINDIGAKTEMNWEWWSNSVEVLDDAIIVTTGGTDVNSTNVYIYDTDAKLVESYNLKVAGMYIHSMEGPFEIKGNKIIFNLTNLTHGGIDLNGEHSGDGINYCDPKALSDNNITDDYPITAKYYVEYLGNGLFSSPKYVEDSAVTVKEYAVSNCDWYNE